MKKNTVCHKCGSENLILMPEDSNSNFIHNEESKVQFLKLSLYTCGTCGFTEHYLRDDSISDNLNKAFN
jgi:predicted nucleic-acid-binding Zn-ribbon protein